MAKTTARSQSLESEKEQLSSTLRLKIQELRTEREAIAELETENRELKQKVQQLTEDLQRERNRALAKATPTRKQRAREEDADDDDDDDDAAAQARKRSRLSLSKQAQPAKDLEATIQQQVADAIKRLMSSGSVPSLLSGSADLLQKPPPSHAHHSYEPHSSQPRFYEAYPGHPSAFQQPMPVPYTTPAPVPPPQATNPLAPAHGPLSWPPSSSTWPSSPVEVQTMPSFGAALSASTVPHPPRATSPAVEHNKPPDSAAAPQLTPQMFQEFQAFREFMANRK